MGYGVYLDMYTRSCKQLYVFSPLSPPQAKEQDLLMPVHTSDTQEEYVGATVIEPVRG